MRRVADKSSILLIGIDSEHPITILEGNHRVLAAALNDPTRVCSLHSYIGLSPKMQECYLYGAESPVFFRQAWRRIRSLQPRLLTAAKASPLFSE
jgi:hypothetical protein